jgi:hypothetical protein
MKKIYDVLCPPVVYFPSTMASVNMANMFWMLQGWRKQMLVESLFMALRLHVQSLFSGAMLTPSTKTTWVLYDGSLKNFFNIHKDQRIFMTLEFNNNHHNWLMSCDYWWLLVFKPLNHWYRSTKTLAAHASSVDTGLDYIPWSAGLLFAAGFLFMYLGTHEKNMKNGECSCPKKGWKVMRNLIYEIHEISRKLNSWTDFLWCLSDV